MHLLNILIPGWRADLDSREIPPLDRSLSVEPVDLDSWVSALSERLTPAPKNRLLRVINRMQNARVVHHRNKSERTPSFIDMRLVLYGFWRTAPDLCNRRPQGRRSKAPEVHFPVDAEPLQRTRKSKLQAEPFLRVLPVYRYSE